LAAPDPLKPALKLLTWNIERGLRLAEIAAAIKQEAPDVCLLQEVDVNARRTGRQNIAESLARQLGYNYVAVAEFQELGQGEAESPAFQTQAILTSLPIRSVRIIRFENQTGFWRPKWYLPNWSVFQRRSGGRVALVAELDTSESRLVVYNLHLESRGIRTASAAPVERSALGCGAVHG
jgi:endonuclease/exonuclease/phosphatase family metal-dependent hydrolase